MRGRTRFFARMVPSVTSAAKAPAWWAACVGLVTLAGFATVRGGGWLAWDDDINITGNPHLQALAWQNVRWMFADFDYMRRYVPLAWLGWAIERALFGLTASASHTGNLLFHSASAVLVFLLVQRVLAMRRIDCGFSPRAMLAACAAGALGWSLHPLRVEVVAWASGRIYCQAVFFLLVAMLGYLQAAEARPGTARARGWFSVSLFAYTISLLTYPLGVTSAGVLLIADIWLLRRFDPRAAWWRNRANRAVLLEKLPFVAVAGLIVALTVLARFHAAGVWDPPATLAQFGVVPRIMQAFYVWAYYVWRPWVPVDLAPVYTTLVRFEPTGVRFVLSALVVVALTVVLFRRRDRFPGTFALWAAHLVLLVPVLGLTEHPHYPNDRYSYLVGVAWAPAAAAALLWVARRADGRAVAVGAAVGLVGLVALSVVQIRIWRSSETLFRYLLLQVGDTPYRADIAFRFAEALRAQGRLPESVGYYRETLRVEPAGRRAGAAHFGLGLAAVAGRRNDEAVRHYEAAIRLQPDYGPAYAGLGEVLALAGRRDDAIASFRHAIALDPQDGVARAALERLLAP